MKSTSDVDRQSKGRSKGQSNQQSDSPQATGEPTGRFRLGNHPFKATLLFGALLWLAMPPATSYLFKGLFPGAPEYSLLSLIAWVAPIPLILVILSKPRAPRLLRSVWLGSWLFWLALLYFIPIPHPALWLGWLALAWYVSIYLPLFVLSARVLVHDLRIEPMIAIPAAWVGWEYFRSIFITGFGLAMFGHSQVDQPVLIQIADLCGAYIISFVMMLVSCALVMVFNRSLTSTRRIMNGIGAVVVVAMTIAYGSFRLAEGDLISRDAAHLNVGVIQGNIDTIFPTDEAHAQELFEFKTQHYRELASSSKFWNARPGNQSPVPAVHLVVWPEGKFPVPDEFLLDHSRLPEFEKTLDLAKANFAFMFRYMQSVERSSHDPPDMHLNPHAIQSIVGGQSTTVENENIFNSAMLVDSNGNVQARYLKNHRVMFGEYIPFENIFPALSKLTPQGRGLTPGAGGTALEVGPYALSPNICFESCVPHLIRRHVNELAEKGQEPDMLVNMSDDGWFYGSSCLDLHLACTTLRSVELRKPTIVAANTGISAHIDGNGRHLKRGPRREPDILFMEVQPDGRYTLYRIVGDWPVFVAMLLNFVALGEWIRRRRRASRTS